jgi:hypothetical protein
MLIKRRQAPDALAIFLTSPSTPRRRRGRRHAPQPGRAWQQTVRDAIAGLDRLPYEGWAQRTWQPDAEHHSKAADLVFQSDPLADQLLASNDQRPDSVRRQ